MDIRGLVLINSPAEAPDDRLQLPGLLALQDVAGRSPLLRLTDRLHRYGIMPVTAVVEETPGFASGRAGWASPLDYRTAAPDRFWRVAEDAFAALTQDGAQAVVVMRLGAYVEVDFERLVQFHLERQCRVSQAIFALQPLEVFCISASRRNDAASLFRSRLARCRSDCPAFAHAGYVNPLSDARDLRQLAIDVLTLQTETRPAGRQLRPGIWVASGSVLEKGSRIVAPAFVGSSARIRTGAVVTRCSAIEHHTQVDCGTVVENSTVLPYAYVGSGLDLAHCVVAQGLIANLRRNAMVEVADEKLIGSVAADSRPASSAVKLISILWGRLWGAVSGKVPVRQPGLDKALEQSSPALGGAAGYRTPACNTNAASDFSSGLAVARRYGDQ
jgi:hypothetical protein